VKELVFKNYNLNFLQLMEREKTDMIVIHHTGNPNDDDLSAEDIHQSHLANGWAGIGYHFVIRKDGTIEVGRPISSVGSHAYGENYHTIGIHVCGNFENAEPTSIQIEALAQLIAKLATDYNIIPTFDSVVGHRDLMATACPGENLYNILDIIRGKAIWYQNN
jgi:N-acetyl-anhydromuramyl-L-alanine amidase AmpD